RGALSATHATIGHLLDDPDLLRARPPLDVDMARPVVPASAPPSSEPTTGNGERVPGDAVSVVSDVPEGAQSAGDPWGPGSWAQ
ncbi:hypothetical protein Q8G71_36230, partial [Klebsiella pneumoniae]